jgi:hypothetical protein
MMKLIGENEQYIQKSLLQSKFDGQAVNSSDNSTAMHETTRYSRPVKMLPSFLVIGGRVHPKKS